MTEPPTPPSLPPPAPALPLGVPDLDDLLHEGVYVLLAKPRGAAAAPPEAFVWIGEDVVGARGPGGAGSFSARVSAEFLKHAGLPQGTKTHTELDGEESDLFWQRFDDAA